MNRKVEVIGHSIRHRQRIKAWKFPQVPTRIPNAESRLQSNHSTNKMSTYSTEKPHQVRADEGDRHAPRAPLYCPNSEGYEDEDIFGEAAPDH